jgi:hypothetical protein
VFENRILRRKFGPKRDEVTGGLKKMNNEVVHNLYSSPSIIRMIKAMRMRLAGHVARMVEKRIEYKILVRKPEGRGPLGRTRRMCVDNIKVNLRVIGWDCMDCIDLAQNRELWRALMNTVMNLRVP